jgi:hypothetical protein
MKVNLNALGVAQQNKLSTVNYHSLMLDRLGETLRQENEGFKRYKLIVLFKRQFYLWSPQEKAAS